MTYHLLLSPPLCADSPAANLLKALEALIREPSGCFEQASPYFMLICSLLGF